MTYAVATGGEIAAQDLNQFRQLLQSGVAGQSLLSAGPNADPIWSNPPEGFVSVKTYGAVGNGVADDTTAIQDALVAAIAAQQPLYLPAGTYLVGTGVTSGSLFSLVVAGQVIYGDGMGRTVIQLPTGVTLTGNMNVFHVQANYGVVRDITVKNGVGMSGSAQLVGVNIDQGAYYPSVLRCEFVGMYGGNTAGGAGVTTFQPYNQTQLTTTLGTAVNAPGSVAVTPASMSGVYVGRTLQIGGTSPEAVVVSAMTALTFTATFANMHTALDSVTGTANGDQYAQIVGCVVRDSFQACGMVIDSGANVIRDNRVVAVGSTSNQHGFYVQGGGNLLEGNYVEGVGGYSYHLHKSVPYVDGSADRVVGNTSIDPGTQHLVVDTLTSDGTNPEVPNTYPLTRSCVVMGNYFKVRVNGTAPANGVACLVPCVVEGNVFEDAGANNLELNTPQSVVQGNIFRMLNKTNQVGILNNNTGVNAPKCLIANNQFINWSGACLKWPSSWTIRGNYFQFSFSGTNHAITQMLSNNVLSDNVFEALTTTGDCLSLITGSTQNDIHDNVFNVQSGGKVAQFNDATYGFTFHDNTVAAGGLVRYDNGSYTQIYASNDTQYSFGGNTALAQTRNAGRLLYFPKGATSLTAGTCLTVASGVLAVCGTSDTVMVGIAPSNSSSSATDFYVAGQPGTIFTGVLADGAWAAGNIGILSTTSAGKVHDTGATTIPGSGSYVVFLNSGGGAGSATVLVCKTL